MVKRALRFLPFLACGVVVTLAICWAPLFFYSLNGQFGTVAAWPEQPGMLGILQADDPPWWSAAQAEMCTTACLGRLGPPLADGRIPIIDDNGPEASLVPPGAVVPADGVRDGPPPWTKGRVGSGLLAVACRVRTGFPAPCLQYIWWVKEIRQHREGVWEVASRFPSLTGPGSVWLPVEPIASGLVINIAFWSMACFAMWRAPGLARRWRRARRGVCIACGYDRRSLLREAPCPECGAVAMTDGKP